MKTQNNNQKTGKSQFSKSTLGASAALFVTVLISLSVNAQDLWKEFSNYSTYEKMALAMDGRLNETEQADAAFEAIHSEVANQLSLANEMFVAEPEKTMEIEGWMSDASFFTEAEQYTANTADTEIAKYARMLTMEIEAEKALEVESWMTDASFFTEAERYTAKTADAEIAKYADRIVNAIEADKDLAIESWMTKEAYFNSPDVLQNEQLLEIESWMLHTKNFSTQTAYKQLAAK